MGCTVFWQCKIYHWDKSVRLLAMPMHTDIRFIFPVECYFLVHLSRRLKCTIVIMRCPSSVVVNFSHFRLLLWNCWTEFNETWQEARSQRPLPSLCFSGRSEKQDGRPGLWLAETFSTSPLKPLNGIQRNLTGSKISTSFTKFVFFGPIGKTRWPPWSLIGLDIFYFFSETAERNSTKLDRKQDLNVLYQVCVFRADRKNKMATLVSDWLRHFWLLLCNRWTEFNKTWQEARSQRPLPSLCFFGRSEKQDGRPGLWLAETFSTSPLKPLNGIQRNLTGSKISTSFTTFVFFGPIRKTRWPPWPLIGWDIFDFFSETAERNSTKLDRKQDLNVFYKVCVFPADRKNKMAALASEWLRHFGLLLWNCWTACNETWQEARSQRPLPRLFFWPMGKTRWPPWPIHQKGGILYSGARYVALWASCFLSYYFRMVWFPVYTKGGGGAGKFYCVRLFSAWARPENLFSGISMPKYLFSSARKFGKKKLMVGD